MKSIALVCSIILVLSSSALAQVTVGDKAEINGNVYTDYYWMAQNHNQDIEGNHGFWFRRIYFTYNQEITEAFSTRLRLEMDSDGSFSASASKMTPVVKDAYLKWKNEKHQLLAGISSTPTWGLVEGVWGYRSVEKSPLDLYGLGSSRDLGISAKGQLDANGKVNYHFMFGNGNSNRANEINEGKKLMLSLGYQTSENLIFEVYGDWNDNTGNTDWMTIQGFGGYQTDDFTIGILYALQQRKNVTITLQGPEDLTLQVASVFSNFTLSDNANGFLRFDHAFDGVPGTDGNDYIPISSQAPSTFIVGGVDFKLVSNVRLIPNIEAVVYGEDEFGNTPDTDLIPRLTLFYSF